MMTSFDVFVPVLSLLVLPLFFPDLSLLVSVLYVLVMVKKNPMHSHFF